MLMLALEVSEDFDEFRNNVEQLNTFSMEKLKYFDETIRIKFLEDYVINKIMFHDILKNYFGDPKDD